MIGILDYGIGNVKAFANVYKRLGIGYRVLAAPQDFDGLSGLILPGVGAFDHAMERLDNSGMRERLDKFALEDQRPILGVCVGMQMLGSSSDEGSRDGLGWVRGVVKKIELKEREEKIPLPHMGWNQLRKVRESPILHGIRDLGRFYFLHSYYFECLNFEDSIAITNYGRDFTSLINAGNIFGIQCHPEKSHQNGCRLLENFANISYASV